MSAEHRGLLVECKALHDVLKSMKLTSLKEDSRKLFYGRLLMLGHRLVKTLFTYRIVSDEHLAVLRTMMEHLIEIPLTDVDALNASHRILFWFSQLAVQRLSPTSPPPEKTSCTRTSLRT